ncbi:MAG TPA: hypothetical protein VHC22_14705 [Pirellulales bacterium]|nr:hypothetical protein [Pirellulales bacterium]
METRCEHCRQDCWVEDALAGEEVLCPWCERTFIAKEAEERLAGLRDLVESLLTEIQPEPATKGPEETQSVAARPARRRAKSRPQSRLVQHLLGLAFVSAVAVVVAIGVWMWAERRSSGWQAASMDPASANYVEWKADPSLVDQLGEFRGIDHFQFRPPKSFSRWTVLPDPGWLPRNGHYTGLRFQGSQGERAELYCSVVTFPPDSPMQGGLEHGLNRFYEWLGYHAAVGDLSRGDSELGVLNGRNCIRAAFFCRLRRRESLRGDAREGIVYVLIDQGRQITLYTLCDPQLQDEHNLMGASLLTWQEK